MKRGAATGALAWMLYSHYLLRIRQCIGYDTIAYSSIFTPTLCWAPGVDDETVYPSIGIH